MAKQREILVTGATGRQGGAVARELMKHGEVVRAMTRKPDKKEARELASLGARVVQGDFDDPRSLEEALEGAWGAFSVQDSWEAGVEREEEQGKRFAELAQRAGVQHFVYSSVGSAHRNTGIPHFDSKWHVEQAIDNLDFPSRVVLRPVFFMENFLSPMFLDGIRKGQIAMGLDPTTALQMIAVADIGRYGRWAFQEQDKLNGRAIDIAGDERTLSETARVIGEAAERKIDFVSVPIEEVRKQSEESATMYEWFDRVGYNVDIDAVSRESGIRPTTLKQWASQVSWPAAARSAGAD